MDSTIPKEGLGDHLEIGAHLRRARESAGRSIQEIADNLPLRPGILEALENDDFENLPAPIFVRGYLRTYARQLDISPDPLLEAYERRSFPPPRLETSTPLSQSIQPSETLFRTLTHVGVAGLIVLFMLWWQSQTPDGFSFRLTDTDSAETTDTQTTGQVQIPDDFSAPSSTGSRPPGVEQDIEDEADPLIGDIEPLAAPQAPDAEASLAANDLRQEPQDPLSTSGREISDLSEPPSTTNENESAANGGQGEAEAIMSAGSAGTNGAADDPVDAPRASTSPSASAAQSSPVDPPAEGLSRLVIRLRHEAWIEVYDRNGERLMFELAEAEREISLVGASPFNVLLGNARDVEVEYNGVPFDYGPHTLNGIARFRLE